MKSKLSRSTYILLTAKSSIDTYTYWNCQALKGKIVVQVWPYSKKAFLPEGFIFFLFLEIDDQLVDENAFENDLVP